MNKLTYALVMFGLLGFGVWCELHGLNSWLFFAGAGLAFVEVFRDGER